jgi:hypothetical protein
MGDSNRNLEYTVSCSSVSDLKFEFDELLFIRFIGALNYPIFKSDLETLKKFLIVGVLLSSFLFNIFYYKKVYIFIIIFSFSL